MFLLLNHKSLDVYIASRELVKEVYQMTNKLPSEERFNMITQLRRAALSVKLNIAEGSTRKFDVERKGFLEVARGSVEEIDTALETAFDLNYLTESDLRDVGVLLNKCFAMLSKMITTQLSNI
jgi:four helix bundle protein